MDSKIKNAIDVHEIISFDIFDTLLVRPYVNPYHLLKHIERFSGQYGFEQLRLRAEWAARRESHDEDITFDDIYSRMPVVLQNMKQQELDCEETVLTGRAEIKEIYDYAVESGKKIAFISDMYLPKDFLQRVLCKNGYKHFDWFYLSSDKKTAKYTGHLFRDFLAQEKLNPKSILHIGDSELSDVKMPQQNGIDTYHVSSIISSFLQRPENAFYQELLEQNPDSLDISILVAIIAQYHQTGNYWKDFAFCIGGPIAYGLVEYAIRVAKQKKSDKLFFIARDGYALKKVADVLSGVTQMPETGYVYAQRILRAKCFGDYGDEHNADVVLLLLKNAGVNVPLLSSFDDKKRFLTEHASELEKITQPNRQEYKKYLTSLGITSRANICVVDSGAATFSAQRLIQGVSFANVCGVYSIITDRVRAAEYQIDCSVWADKPDDIRHITSVIEFILQAPEAPVIGIKKLLPVYATPMPAEQQRLEIAPFLSDGIVAFAEYMKNRFKQFLPSLDATEVDRWVCAHFKHFSHRDIEFLGSVPKSSNASHTEYKQNVLQDILAELKESYYWVRLFGIPFIKCSEKYVKLFSVIPILTIKTKNSNTKYAYLFGLFKIIKIIKKD